MKYHENVAGYFTKQSANYGKNYGFLEKRGWVTSVSSRLMAA